MNNVRTAFIVRVPEAEAWIGDLRRRFDPSARDGVPAHVTLLHPFMDPALVDAGVLAAAREAIASVRAFGFELSRTGRFEATAYLAPEPAAPFTELIRRLVDRFPSFPPYGGAHADIRPHLTVAHGDASTAAMVGAELASVLSVARIRSRCAEVALIGNATGVWREMQAFPLAASGWAP